MDFQNMENDDFKKNSLKIALTDALKQTGGLPTQIL